MKYLLTTIFILSQFWRFLTRGSRFFPRSFHEGAKARILVSYILLLASSHGALGQSIGTGPSFPVYPFFQLAATNRVKYEYYMACSDVCFPPRADWFRTQTHEVTQDFVDFDGTWTLHTIDVIGCDPSGYNDGGEPCATEVCPRTSVSYSFAEFCPGHSQSSSGSGSFGDSGITPMCYQGPWTDQFVSGTSHECTYGQIIDTVYWDNGGTNHDYTQGEDQSTPLAADFMENAATNHHYYAGGSRIDKYTYSDPYTTDMLVSPVGYNDFSDWDIIGFADGEIYLHDGAEADSERCAYLQKMRYCLGFVAPAGQPFDFDVQYRFYPEDGSPSYIIGGQHASGTGTGQVQYWPNATTGVEVDPYFFSVTDGSGCPHTRGGLVFLEIPPGPNAGAGGPITGGPIGGVPPPGFPNPGDPGGGGGCATCSCSGPTVGSFSAANNSVSVQASLGKDAFGTVTGSLFIEETNSSAALFTPARLQYLGGFTNAEFIYDAGGNFRQVKTPQGFADIVTNSTATAYDIRIYAPFSGSKTGGLYSPPLDHLLSTGTIAEVSGSTNQCRLTVLHDGTTNIYDYVWSAAANGWALTSGGGLRTETVAWNTGTNTKTNTVTDTGANILFQKTTTYYDYPAPLGRLALREIVDPLGAALTTQWSYYTNATLDGTNYGKLKMVVQPSGLWTSYQYDTNGNLSKTVSQFLNAATNAADNLCHVVTNGYALLGGSLYSLSTAEFLLGQEISRSYRLVFTNQELLVRCQTAGAAWNASDNLTATNKYYGSGDFTGKLQSTQNPDGTMSLYSYATNSGVLETDVSTGEPGAGGTTIVDGTLTISKILPTGELSAYGEVDIKSGITTATNAYTYTDLANRSYTYTSLDGQTQTVNAACCGVDNTIDKDGVTTQYYYDALRRQVASTRNGIMSTNVLDASGRVIATKRIGTDSSVIVQSQMTYDRAGRLVQSINALGGATTYTNVFDGSGQTITTNTAPDGGTTIETYAQNGSLLSVMGTAAHPMKYLYGVETDGGVERAYTVTVALASDGGTNEWTKTYTDMLGRQYKAVYASASSNPYAISYYNSRGQLTNQIDPDGVSTIYLYNARGEAAYTVLDMNQNGTIDFAGTDWITFTTNDVVSDHGANVRRARTWVWNLLNSNSSNLVSTLETSADGLQSFQTIFNSGIGITTTNATKYAGSGYRYQTNGSPDGTYALSIFLNGQRLQKWTTNGSLGQLSRWTNTYDAHGRLSTVSDVRTGTSTKYYNAMDQVSGSVTTSSNVTAQTTTYFFDQTGRNYAVQYPDSTYQSNIFTLKGELQLTYGSRQYPVGYSYDAQGRMVTVTNWSSLIGNVGSRITTWNYDAYRGWLKFKDYPNATTGLPPSPAGTNGPVYTYTAAGRIATRTWARGVSTTYAHDNSGQVSGLTYSDTTPSVAYGFDRLGRRTSIVDAAGTNYLTLSDAGNVLIEAYTNGLMSGWAVTNGYDTLLRRTNLVTLYNGGVQTMTTNNYDAASRLSLISDRTNSATYSYLANAPFVQQILFQQSGTTRMTTTNGYDNLNRLTRIASIPSASSTISFDYQYNSANQRTKVTQADGTYWLYSYDALGQVVSGNKYWSDGTPVAGEQFGYAFDDIGNRTSTSAGGDQYGANLRYGNYTANALNQYTSRTIPGAVDIIGSATNASTVTVNNQSTYRHSDFYRAQLSLPNTGGAVYQSITNLAALNRGGTTADLVSNITGNVFLPQTPEQFTYDADGNLTSDGRWTNFWNAEHRLISMTSLSSSPTGSKLQLQFAYDERGRRIQKLVSVWNGTAYVPSYTNRFVYEGWNLVAEINPANTYIRGYLWGSDLSGTMQGAVGVGGLLAIKDNTTSPATNYFCAYDANGNPNALTSADSGNQITKYEYGPFGELLRAIGAIAKANPFRFSTKYQDDETLLLNYGHRYYAPSTDRWPSRDPFGEKGGFNLYAFLGNNPINKIDVLGNDALVVNAGGAFGHTSFVIVFSDGTVMAYHFFSKHWGVSWYGAIAAFCCDKVLIWSQFSPSLSEYLAGEESQYGAAEIRSYAFGTDFDDSEAEARMDEAMRMQSGTYSVMFGNQCHSQSRDWFLEYVDNGPRIYPFPVPNSPYLPFWPKRWFETRHYHDANLPHWP